MKVDIEVRSSGPGPAFTSNQHTDTASAVRIMEYLTAGVLLASHPHDGVAVIIRRAK
jgi:hypothetical protein